VSSHPEAVAPVDFRAKGGTADRVFKGTTLAAGALVLAVLTLIAAVMISVSTSSPKRTEPRR